jgi:hypothetical protein
MDSTVWSSHFWLRHMLPLTEAIGTPEHSIRAAASRTCHHLNDDHLDKTAAAAYLHGLLSEWPQLRGELRCTLTSECSLLQRSCTMRKCCRTPPRAVCSKTRCVELIKGPGPQADLDMSLDQRLPRSDSTAARWTRH